MSTINASRDWTLDSHFKQSPVRIDVNDLKSRNPPWTSEVIQTVSSIVRNRDFKGDLRALAQELHTDLSQGLPATPSEPCDRFGDDNVSIEDRKRIFGDNVYPRKKSKSLWRCLWTACRDTTLIILMLCAGLSIGFGMKTDGVQEGWYDGVSIAVAILLVIIVTGVSDFKQSRQFQRLSHEVDNIKVELTRGGCRINVSSVDIVVGDVVQLKVGDQVPADGLLIAGYSLSIDESSFTGESEYYMPDPSQQAFLRSGSKVQEGYGSMLVTAVGANTEWGHMMKLLSNDNMLGQTPLQERLTEAATLIGKVGLSVALLLLVILIAFYFTGHSSTSGDAKFRAGDTNVTDAIDALVHIFSIAVTIVVVAVPEGLPLAVTLTLAYSMRKMMKDNALVRRLAACETMGSATTICSDKTGTLTVNQMTVVNSWVAGKIIPSESDTDKIMCTFPTSLRSLLFQGIAQNTTGSVFPAKSCCRRDELKGDERQALGVAGSPTEAALLWWGLKAGMDFEATRLKSLILQVQTFNSATKRAGVAVQNIGHRLLVVHWKGAAEIILSMCSKWIDMEQLETDDDSQCSPSEKPISAEKRQEIMAIIDSMACSSLRCVAMAYTTVEREDEEEEITCNRSSWSLPESNLTLLAIVGMKDPYRPEVKAAVADVRRAGVTVRMVTGDSLQTAKAIALECGILAVGCTDELIAIEGAALRSWTDEERRKNLPGVAIVARALPSDKLLLVETLQSMGEVVAVTGDGTNDAPALRKADIGLSMGIQGTEVAKESSAIIILDDNFTSVVKAVRWGRSINFNIQKFLQFQLTVNVTALTVNFVAAMTSGDVPLTVVQLLWVNLIMDTLGALALATEPPTDELMQKPPMGRHKPLINHAMWKNLMVQAIYQVVVLLILQFRGIELLHLSGEKDAETIKRTVIFNTFVLCQLFNEVNSRQPYKLNIFEGLQENCLFMVIVGATLALQVVMVEFLEKFASTIRCIELANCFFDKARSFHP
ncbi:hypothetical protein KP509_30G029100 [Ceratopteris richardii]|uniref:Calcium-transporting ATPase n=1 Tax=Ceratopteris richardii TaxID=49495 RepID=A0A8T2R168_CERRI|nr:hypothetical protein KP509_30G029100 [Ceratopteris richardii]